MDQDSATEDKKWECRKKCHRTKNSAKHARRVMRKKHPGKKYTIYYCDECSSYHLTSMKARQSREFRNFLQNQKRNEENE